MKPDDVQPEMFIKYCIKHNDKDPNFKVGGHMLLVGLDAKVVQLQLYVLAHIKSKTHMWYVACLKYCMICLTINLFIYSFSTLLTTLLLALPSLNVLFAYIQLIIYFFHKNIFGFLCTC